VAGAVNDLSYQLRVTRFENGGLIVAPIEPPLSMFSLDLRSAYQLKNDIELSLWLNYQKDNFEQRENFGIIFSIAKQFQNQITCTFLHPKSFLIAARCEYVGFALPIITISISF
jgi:hypothetical protein